MFCFHNGIIHTLNKVHTKKLGSPANTQLNLRLILENVNPSFLSEFREKIELQIKAYEKEINQILTEQIGTTGDAVKRLNVFKLDMFSRKIVQDKYSRKNYGILFIFWRIAIKKKNGRHKPVN